MVIYAFNTGPGMCKHSLPGLLRDLKTGQVTADRAPDVVVGPRREHHRSRVIAALSSQGAQCAQHTFIDPGFDLVADPDGLFTKCSGKQVLPRFKARQFVKDAEN